MNKLTKISVAALLALFLSACDKPAEKAEAAKAETATTQAANQVASNAQGLADFQKLLEWNKSQEESLGSLQADLQAKITTGDKAKIEEAFNSLKAKIAEISKSLDGVEVKDPSVNEFKAKIKDNFAISAELVSDYVQTIVNPTEENKKMVQEKSQTMIKAGQELQQLQLQLQQKFISPEQAK